jgi:branched-chain amino acid transport system substrate-binding protein
MRHLRTPLEAAGWQIAGGGVFEDTRWLPTLGRPAYVNEPDGLLPFANIIAKLRIKSSLPSPQDLVPSWLHVPLVFGCLALLLLSQPLCNLRWFQEHPVPLFLLRLATTLLLLLTAHAMVQEAAQTRLSFNDATWLNKVFQALWWLVPAAFINRFIDRIIWPQLERRVGHPIPLVLSGTVHWIIYLLAIGGVLAFVLNWPIAGLLATSGLISFIIGMAINANIAQVFSGLLLSATRPFKIGDLVQIPGGPLGFVKEMSLRTVTIEDFDKNIHLIPNTQASDATVQVMANPNQPAPSKVAVYVSPRFPPQDVVAALTRALDDIADRVVRDESSIGYKGQETVGKLVAKHYRASLIAPRAMDRAAVADAFWSRAWERCNEAGIDLCLDAPAAAGSERASTGIGHGREAAGSGAPAAA